MKMKLSVHSSSSSRTVLDHDLRHIEKLENPDDTRKIVADVHARY